MTHTGDSLSAARREFDALVGSVKDYAIFLIDPEGYILTWNDGARAIKLYTASEAIGKHFSCFFTAEALAEGRPARLLETATKEGRVEDEGWRVRKDGSLFWADVVITRLTQDDGTLKGFVKLTRDLTARKAAEDALRWSEESLSATLYSIADGVITTDVQGRTTRMNPMAENLTGWAQGEALGQPIDTVFHIVNERTRALAANPVKRVLAEGLITGLANHTVLISRDGTDYPIADSGGPIRSSSGAVLGAVLVFRDVTDERRAEETLRQSEERLRLMIASVADYAIFMLDAAGRVASWNPGAERLKGYRAQEIIGSHFSRFYPPEDVAAGKPARGLSVAAHDGRVEDEGWRIRKDGSRFWANVVMSAIRDDSGKLVGFTKVTRDMTERRRMEQEMARQAAQQAAVAELGIYALRTLEVQPVMQRAVQVVTQMLGTEMGHVLELLPDSRSFLARAGVGWKDGSIGTATVRADRDTQAGYALISAEPVVVSDLATETRFRSEKALHQYGVVSGVSAVIPLPGQPQPYGVLGAYSSRRLSFSPDDVSFVRAIANVIANAILRSLTEEQLLKTQRAAEKDRGRATLAVEAVRGRDVFLSVAAHELRTPLTALQLKLQGLEQMIRKELAGAREVPKWEGRFQDARRQMSRLAELVERLLDISRIAAGRLELERKSLELGSLVQQVVSDFQEEASKTRTDIRTSISGDTHGVWDRGRMEQVLVNLLSNAMKYGEGQLIQVTVEGAESEVRLLVSDRGIGIAAGDVNRIFEAFERAAPVEHFSGLGLGLFIARHIVEAHGGRIEVSSKPNEGATFVITLPKDDPGGTQNQSRGRR